MKLAEVKALDPGTELVYKSEIQTHDVEFVKTEQIYTGRRHATIAIVQRKDNGRLVYAQAKHLSRPRPLGEHQYEVLRCLNERHCGPFFAGCRWIYGNYSRTVSILDSLVKRGLATRFSGPISNPGPRGNYEHVEYRISPRGQRFLEGR